MACNASQVLASGIEFDGLSIPQIKAVQLQLAASVLLAISPGANVSSAAVLARAEGNRFTHLIRNQLRTVTLELLCGIKEAV